MSRMLLIVTKKDNPAARRVRARRLLSIFLLGLLLSIGALPAAAQNTFTVINTQDSGPGSLSWVLVADDADSNEEG